MKRTTVYTGLVLALCWTLPAQDAPRPIEDKEARTLVTEFNKLIKDNKKNLSGRLEAVKKLGGVSNAMFVTPLLKTARTDSSLVVRRAATEAIGAQPKTQARKALTMLLKKADITKQPDELASVVKALDGEAFDDRDWTTLQRMFDKSLAEKDVVNAQVAIIQLAGSQKVIDAAEYLIQHIDAPAPAWVDDPSNPPQAYWEARWKNWQKWQGHVKESVFQITGQRFGTTKEARVWMKANLKELRRQARTAGTEKDKDKEKKR